VATLEIREDHVDYFDLRLPVFSVLIDGEVISDRVAPFTAAASSIESRICEECYGASKGELACCSAANIAVRRHNDAVFWFLADDGLVCPPAPNIALNQVWSFRLDDYELLLPGNTSQLPDFTAEEMRLILKRGASIPLASGCSPSPIWPTTLKDGGC
jgi:hypothetical protein